MSNNDAPIASGLITFAGFVVASAVLAAAIHQLNSLEDSKRATKLAVRKSFIVAPNTAKAPVCGPDAIAKPAPHKDVLDSQLMNGKLLAG